ncbi:MAG: hypothetical protein ACP5QK_05495 [Myxococcota bacterium]
MEDTKQMISVWFWVGCMMLIYGLIITGAGVYYLFLPPQSYAAKWTNPNLWWGMIMLIVGQIFLYLGRIKKSSI